MPAIFAAPPPAIIELGTATGFDVVLQDRASLGHATFMEARNQLLDLAAQSKVLTAVRPNGLDDEPQYKIDIDWEKASAFGLSISDINTTLSTAWGSSFVNQFVDRGRVKRVFVQGDAPYRMRPEDFGHWYVRNSSGDTAPFSAFASGHWTHGPPKLERYNGMASIRNPRRAGARLQHGRGDAGDGAADRPAAPRRRSRMDRLCPMRSDCQAVKPRRCTRSRSSSCSSAWRRSTRAGRSRSR